MAQKVIIILSAGYGVRQEIISNVYLSL